jgi:biopolymer transport protein ExbD
MEVMNLLRAAGYLKVALVGLESSQPTPAGTEPDAAGSRP